MLAAWAGRCAMTLRAPDITDAGFQVGDHISFSDIMNVLQTHPPVFVNGRITPNPHYVPMHQFLGDR
jgi:hypothetical protein